MVLLVAMGLLSAGSRTTVWAAVDSSIFNSNTLFIEAEDVDYDHGKYINDPKKIGMDGPYPGGAYKDLGSDTDNGFDWQTNGNAGQAYRPGTGLAAGKENGSARSDRGYFEVKNWWTLGWNDSGEWYNYTREFPTPAKDYFVFGNLSSGGSPIHIQLDQITSGAGLSDDQQQKKLLGVFKPGRATAGWDTLEIFQLTDDNGKAVTVNLGGKVTLRTTILPNSNSDQDYFAFVPANEPFVSLDVNPLAVIATITDVPVATVDPKSVALKVDGTAVTAAATKSGAITTATYSSSTRFEPGTKHTIEVTVKDAGSKTYTTTRTLTLPSYGIISQGWAVQPDTSKRGFLVRTWKSTGQPNNLAWTEEQLRGLRGDNEADVSQFTEKAFGNSYYPETGTINYWNSGGQGNFSNNDASGTGVQNTPGLANDGSNDDNYSLEIITAIDLPAGVVRLGVNSDDGFRVSAIGGGDPRDVFATTLGQFDGGRGVANTEFSIFVEKAGIYPFRMIYEEGGGASAVEWYSISADGTRHLINDAKDANALKSYRSAPQGIYVESVTPGINDLSASDAPTISAVIADGARKVTPASVKLTLDGAAVTATASKSGDKTTVSFKASAQPEGSKHKVTLSYADDATPPNSRTVSWSYEVPVTTKTFVAGTLFIEAEDVDYGHGKYIKDPKLTGMSGAYAGGAYEALGTADDKGFDWNTNDNAGQAYRPDTGIAAGKKDGSAGNERGLFQVSTWWTLGWNDGGEWYNYTRDFPTPAKDYEVYGHLSSGGAAINIRVDQITSGQGQADAQQVKKTLGYFRPGRATAGWDTLEIFRLTDADGNPITVNLGGATTLRTTIVTGSNSDQDYFAFVPAKAAPPPTDKPKISSVKSDGKNLTLGWSGTATLQAADEVTGPWADVAGAASGKAIAISGNRKFYRLKQ
jgi:hypothetical protein